MPDTIRGAGGIEVNETDTGCSSMGETETKT